MYKRKARVVFFCAGNAGYCLAAAEFADRLGQDWIEARVAVADTERQDPRTLAAMGAHRESPVPTEALFMWADLVVTIGDAAAAHCPALPAHVQKKHWAVDPLRLDEAQGVVAQAVRDDIRARVEGIVGGLRLMAKSDS